jgi:hypothetical protein
VYNAKASPFIVITLTNTFLSNSNHRVKIDGILLFGKQ